jgi:hypothetical protein
MSTYREPGVKVAQEFANALPALAAFALPNVNVGPAFQVVRDKNAGDYEGTQADYTYPDQILGTYVDTRAADPDDLIAFPVQVSLQNTVVTYLARVTSGVVSGSNLNRISDAGTGMSGGALPFDNARPGDVIVITTNDEGNQGIYAIREKISGTEIVTNETLAGAETGFSYELRRNLQTTEGTIPVPASALTITPTRVTIAAGLTHSSAVLGSNLPINAADVYMSYRALRLEKSADLAPYTKIADLQADFGLDQIVPENPVVFAAFLALNNSPTETNILALGQDYLTDELIAYGKAFDVLGMTDIYAISVMTHNSSVHTALKAHCNGFSEPTSKRERVGIVNRRLVTSAVVVDAVTSVGSGVLSASVNGVATATSASSHFITDGVVPGHFFKLTSPTGAAGRYKVVAVPSQTQIQFEASISAPAGSVTFQIEKDFTKNEQATTLAAYANSLGSRRLAMTWPDVVRIPVGAAVRDLPGYFLNCAVGALTTGLPTQQGFTNLSVAVYQGVRHSTKYFDRDQLNLLAAGGVMIFVQDTLDVTALYIRHQLTTDTSAIKFQEYSVTKNVDFIAKFIRTNHLAFIGQYNITDATLDELKANATGIIKYLSEQTKRPKIGGVIKGGRLETIKQDTVNIDTVIERWVLDIPIPLNNLDITIVV